MGAEPLSGRRALVFAVGAFLVAAGLLWALDAPETALPDYDEPPSARSVADLDRDITAAAEAVRLMQTRAAVSDDFIWRHAASLEQDLAAAAASVLALQTQMLAQADKLAAVERALAEAQARIERATASAKPRRKSVPDPPASSYLRLQ